ncbi:DUF6359 domain-containing protein [Coprobacter sp.]
MIRKLLIAILCYVCSVSLYAGDGSENSPFTVGEALSKKNNNMLAYVNGYIVGEYVNYSNNKHFYNMAPPFQGTSTYLIADNPLEYRLDKCMTVQLGAANTDICNLEEYPWYWNKKLLLQGNLSLFQTLPGIKNLRDFVLPIQPLEDETVYWNIFEDFETKNGYKPASGNMYGGGTFYGADGAIPWAFEGATLGETGNDAKWDGASAHLRLTESTSGNPGCIYMKDDKQNGIGYIRFWAAFYDTDKRGKIAVYISGDQGKTWERVASGLTPEKTLKEFQVPVNRQGSFRIKIAKSENSSDGVNVDNIRISDYLQPAAVSRSESDIPFLASVKDGILFLDLTEKANDIQIYTVNGILVYSIKNSEDKIVVSLLPGMYIIRCGEYSRKIIV